MSATERRDSVTNAAPSGGPRPMIGRKSWLSSTTASIEAEQARTVLVDQLQHLAAPASYPAERILGNHHRQAGLFHQQLVAVAQQRATAGEHDAALGDVRTQLGRRLLERGLDRANDALQRLLQRLEDLVRVEREAARHALGEIAA